MRIILIFNEAYGMDSDAARSDDERELLALLAGSIAHVCDYLRTGSARSALRARLLLDRLETASGGSDGQAQIP